MAINSIKKIHYALASTIPDCEYSSSHSEDLELADLEVVCTLEVEKFVMENYAYPDTVTKVFKNDIMWLVIPKAFDKELWEYIETKNKQDE